MSLESNRNVTVHIEHPGLGALGTFATRTGGKADSEETKHKPGGMLPEQAWGGAPTTDNVVLTRQFVRERDAALRAGLLAARGKARVKISDQLLDPDGNGFAAPTVWTGILKSFDMPDADANSNDAAMLELEVSTDAPVTA